MRCIVSRILLAGLFGVSAIGLASAAEIEDFMVDQPGWEAERGRPSA